MGTLHEAGTGVPRDEAAAAAWYARAAAQGHVEAYVHLGRLHELGRGVPRDSGRAASLYREAAERGSLEGMLRLGLAYWHGEGLPMDRAEAYPWLEMARFHSEQTADMRLRRHARRALDALRAEMSAAELDEGRQRLKGWVAARRAVRQPVAGGSLPTAR